MHVKYRFIGLLICFLLFNNYCGGKTVFVSVHGSNSNSGTIHRPFRTLQFAFKSISEWDTCFIRGGSYSGSLLIENPYKWKSKYVSPYHNEHVTIKPKIVQSNWELFHGRIYRVKNQQQVVQLFIDTVPQSVAAYPNHGAYSFNRKKWMPIYASSNKRVYLGTKKIFKNLDGAFLMGSCGRKIVSFSGEISSYSRNSIEVKNNGFYWESSHKTNYLGKGTGILVGRLEFLDTPGEWFQDSNYLYYCPESISDLSKIRIATKKNNLEVKGYNIRLNNLNFIGYRISMNKAQRCSLNRSNIKYSTPFFLFDSGFDHVTNFNVHIENNKKLLSNGKGIELGGRRNQLLNSVIQYSWGDGVTVTGNQNSIKNCYIKNCNYAGIDAFGVNLSGIDHHIKHNVIKNVGRSAVLMSGLKRGVIQFNDISHAGLLNDDLGLIYTYGSSGGGTEISYNWIHDNEAKLFGAGIYLDNNHSDFKVHHNVVWNCYVAMCVNQTAKNDLIYNNTFFHNKYSMASCIPDGLPPNLIHVLTYNNLTDSKLISRDCNVFYGTIQKNNKYVRNLSSYFVNPIVHAFSFEKSKSHNFGTLGAYNNQKWDAGITQKSNKSRVKAIVFGDLLVCFCFFVVSFLLIKSIFKVQPFNSSPSFWLFLSFFILYSLTMVWLYDYGYLDTYFSDEFILLEKTSQIYFYFKKNGFEGFVSFVTMDKNEINIFFQTHGLSSTFGVFETSHLLLKLNLILLILTCGFHFTYVTFLGLLFLLFLFSVLKALNTYFEQQIRILYFIFLFPSFFVLLFFNLENFILALCLLLFIIPLIKKKKNVYLLIPFVLIVVYNLDILLFIAFCGSIFVMFIFKCFIALPRKFNVLFLLLLISLSMFGFEYFSSSLIYLQLDLYNISVDQFSNNLFDFVPLKSDLIFNWKTLWSVFTKFWLFTREIKQVDLLYYLHCFENGSILLFIVLSSKIKTDTFLHTQLSKFVSFIFLMLFFISYFVGNVTPTILFCLKYKIFVIILIFILLFIQKRKIY